MVQTRRGKIAATAAMLVACFSMMFVTAPSASAASGTITGSVTCFYGNDAEVGVWVNATSGKDGFANWWPNGYGGINYSYTLSQSSSYKLHIGCGNNTQSWGATFYTHTVNGQSYDWICSLRTGCYLS